MGQTHYQTLGLEPSATIEQIRSAYRNLAKVHHPDTGAEAGHQQMILLNEAYEVLSEPERRSLYDRLLGLSAPTLLKTPKIRVASEEEARILWLKGVYHPVNIGINQIVKPFRRQLDALSYDPYDDELVGEFTAYLERSQQTFQKIRQVFASQRNPVGSALTAELLFHSLNQLGDALEELRYFTLNYNYQHLHVGQELLGIVADLRRQAAEAAEHLLRMA